MKFMGWGWRQYLECPGELARETIPDMARELAPRQPG